MRRVTIVLAAGLALLAVAIGLTLLHSPMVLARKNGTPVAEQRIATTRQSVSYCQAHELLPRGTSAIRLSLGAGTGPRVSVSVSAAGHVVTTGTQGSGWTGRVVTVPVAPLSRTVSDATVCASLTPRDENLIVFGETTPPAIAASNGGQRLAGRMWIEYLRPGSSSWASQALAVARRMGLGRALAGTWNALLVAELLAAIAILTSTLVLRELR